MSTIEKLPHPNLASDRAICIKINEIIEVLNSLTHNKPVEEKDCTDCLNSYAKELRAAWEEEHGTGHSVDKPVWSKEAKLLRQLEKDELKQATSLDL